MGNIDSRAKHGDIYLFVKMNQPYYYPGNKVYGKIYIRTKEQIEPNFLEVFVKGKEKVDQEQEGKPQMNQVGSIGLQRKKSMVHKLRMFKFQGKAFQFDEPLGPGDYTVPFDFTLPNHIPASFSMHNYNKEGTEPECMVKYTFKIVMHMHSGDPIAYKCQIVVQQPPIDLATHAKKDNTVKNCCSQEKGSTQTEATFDKTYYYTNEVANALLKVDNSNCKVPVDCVEFIVRQKTIVAGHLHEKDILTKHHHQEIPAGHSKIEEIDLALDFGQINHVPEANKRSGKPKSLEELHMQSKLPPVVKSKLIQNDYELVIQVTYQGHNCGIQVPCHSVPLTLVNCLHKYDIYNVEEPEGYDPTELSNFHIDLVADQDVTPQIFDPDLENQLFAA